MVRREERREVPRLARMSPNMTVKVVMNIARLQTNTLIIPTMKRTARTGFPTQCQGQLHAIMIQLAPHWFFMV